MINPNPHTGYFISAFYINNRGHTLRGVQAF